MRKLLIVLASGVIAAFLLTAFFVMNYGPSGSYQLTQVLLEPATLAKLNYNDFDPKIASNDRFIFDKVEIEYKEVQGVKKRVLDLTTYAQIYELLKNDRSIQASKELERYFESEPYLKLSIYVRTESNSAWQAATKLFQEVEVAGLGDYYRVSLHEDNRNRQWVFFYHPKLLKEIGVIAGFLKDKTHDGAQDLTVVRKANYYEIGAGSSLTFSLQDKGGL